VRNTKTLNERIKNQTGAKSPSAANIMISGDFRRFPEISNQFQSIPITFWKIVMARCATRQGRRIKPNQGSLRTATGAKAEDEDEDEDD
jgi:hypothetical protein